MGRFFLFIFFLTFTAFGGSNCKKQASDACLLDPYAGASSTSAYAVFDRVTEISTECFYDQTFKGNDWRKEVKLAREKVRAESTPTEVQTVLTELLQKLKSSHTEFLLDSDQEYWAIRSIFSGKLDGKPFYQVGAIFDLVDGKWFVRSVFEGSPAYRAGLKRGDEIVDAGGKAFAPVASFSSGRRVALTVRSREKGETKLVRVKPKWESLQRSMYRASKLSARIYRKRGKRVGYFHLWSGTQESFKRLLARTAQRMARQTDALILDLRDGYGGASVDYLDPFFKPAPAAYAKPLYALVNPGVRSGKESLAYALSSKKRATLVGTTTAGYYLGGRLFEITADHSALYLAVCGDAPVGVALEGVGVKPDVEVPSPLGYSEGADRPLGRALELATGD